MWQYITLRTEFTMERLLGAGGPLIGDGHRFSSPQEALSVLGSEGWECIGYSRNDGPRPTIIPGSLVQTPQQAPQYELVFKRFAPNTD